MSESEKGPVAAAAAGGSGEEAAKGKPAVKSSGTLSHFIGSSASKMSMTAVQQELVCSVCLDLFNDPVCLNCGHNICYKCAYRLVSFANACKTFQPETVNLKAEQSRDSLQHASDEAARVAVSVLMPSEDDRKESLKEKETLKALQELAEPVDPAIEVTCPLCRFKTRLGDVKPNIVLRNMVADLRLRAPPSFMPKMIEERRQLEKEQEILKEQLLRRPHCGFLKGDSLCYKDATIYCADCGSLCEEHSKLLHSSGPMRFHQLSAAISPEVYCKTREIIFGSRSSVGLDVSTMPVCSLHKKPLELFCKKCKEAVCSHCVLVSNGVHHDHECISMSQAAECFDDWIKELRTDVKNQLPSSKAVVEAYEKWLETKQPFYEQAMNEIRMTYRELMGCAEEHERTVAARAKKMYDSFDENTMRRAEGVRCIIARGHELIDRAHSSERMSSFARELLERDLKENLLILQSVINAAPKEDSAIVSVEDHRKLLRDMKIVTVARKFRLSGSANCFFINLDSFTSSRSSPSDISCEDHSAHDGGAIIDVERRLIVSVSGNCRNGKDVFLINIDTKRSERLSGIIPYGNHGQYPVFDGEKRVYFFESESRNNDRFGYLDLETKTFKELAKCPRSFREFASPCYMEGHVYAVCRDKTIWDYDVEKEKWTDLGVRVGKVRMAADPLTHSLVLIKKRAKFWSYNVETKEETVFPLQPSNFNLGSNQEMLFLRRTPEDFIVIVSLDSHSLYAFISAEKKWVRLQWRDVRNGSAHLVFDPVTSAFYYKIDDERTWFTAPVKMD